MDRVPWLGLQAFLKSSSHKESIVDPVTKEVSKLTTEERMAQLSKPHQYYIVGVPLCYFAPLLSMLDIYLLPLPLT